MEWRLLLTGLNNVFTNMAIDESILVHRSKNRVPSTIRIYGRTSPSVTIGYFQDVGKVVDVDKCRKLGVNIVRRMTGGGATFHDKEVTYSLFAPGSDPSIPSDVQESFRKICGGVVRGLSILGIKSKFSEPNDITVGGRKVSGNAQTRKSGVLLHQGTVLLDMDVDRMFSVLKVPSEKLRAKMLSDARKRVAGINTLLGRETGFDEVCRALISGFEEELGIDLVAGSLTESELELAERLEDEKYRSEEWNFKQ